MSTNIRRYAAGLFLIVLSGAALASGTNGTYQTADGYYRINVTFGPGTLTVVEPNKTSVYRLLGNEYHFTNPTNGISYVLKVRDARTLLAYKPGREYDNTQLNLVQAAQTTPAPQPQQPQRTPEYTKYMQAAERYKTLAQEDRIKAQIWSACSAAALAYAQKPRAEGEAYARQTASMLKTIMLYPEKTPCEDAIPASVWQQAQ